LRNKDKYNKIYNLLYKKWIKSVIKVDELLVKKDILAVKKEFLNFLHIYKKLKEYNYD